MMDFMFGNNEYPLDAYWFERNQPSTVDDELSYEGAVPFKYRKTKSTSQREQVINGLKMITYNTSIRTKADIPFKAKDKVYIGAKKYTVKSVDSVENDLYKDSRIIYTNYVDYETEIVLE